MPSVTQLRGDLLNSGLAFWRMKVLIMGTVAKSRKGEGVPYVHTRFSRVEMEQTDAGRDDQT